MAPSDIDVEGETDRLYQLPLGEFIAARNALAGRLKTAGDKDGAARVRSLPRPSVPAWAANVAYWKARREFDALVASTRGVQAAQAGGAAGAALREAMKARREAQAAVLAQAKSLLATAGHDASRDTLKRLTDTLDALAGELSRGGGSAHPGRLVGDLEPPGFEALAALAVDPSPTPVAAAPAGDAGSSGADTLENARAGLTEAERRLERARREAREAEGARLVAEKRAEGARDELDEATRRFERAKERHALAAADAAAARDEADRTAAAREAAEAARDAAARSLRDSE